MHGPCFLNPRELQNDSKYFGSVSGLLYSGGFAIGSGLYLSSYIVCMMLEHGRPEGVGDLGQSVRRTSDNAVLLGYHVWSGVAKHGMVFQNCGSARLLQGDDDRCEVMVQLMMLLLSWVRQVSIVLRIAMFAKQARNGAMTLCRPYS